ncbi:DUF4282 domain-containing protein [Nocardiopsis flavescens]
MTTPPEQPHDPSQYGGDPSRPYGGEAPQYGDPSQQYGGEAPQYGDPSQQYGADPSQYGQQQAQQPYAQQQYPTGGQVPPGYQPPPPAAPAAPGFFGILFDFTFREFLTSRMVKVLYILWLVFIGISTLTGIIGAFSTMTHSALAGVLGLFGTLVGGAAAVLVTRVVLELLIVVFRIGDDLSALRRARGV